MRKSVLKIYCDGGARGNPGPAAAAFIVVRDGKVIFSKSKYLGVSTNNYAEYSGVLIAVEWLSKNIKERKAGVRFFLDSELVTNQLKGNYKVKSNNLKPLVLKIKEKEKRIPFRISYGSVSRSKNKLADHLVNKVLDRRASFKQSG